MQQTDIWTEYNFIKIIIQSIQNSLFSKTLEEYDLDWTVYFIPNMERDSLGGLNA